MPAKIPIDFKKVDDLLASGCSGQEVADFLGINEDTLYHRVREEFNVETFSAYSAKKRSKGNALLRAAQFQKAIKGDNTQLIWLGKQRLGQREPREEIDTDKNITIKLINARSDSTPQVQVPPVSG